MTVDRGAAHLQMLPADEALLVLWRMVAALRDLLAPDVVDPRL